MENVIDKLWVQFEGVLAKNRLFFQQISGVTNEDEIRKIKNDCEITNSLHVGAMITEFKRRGKYLLFKIHSLFFICPFIVFFPPSFVLFLYSSVPYSL